MAHLLFLTRDERRHLAYLYNERALGGVPKPEFEPSRLRLRIIRAAMDSEAERPYGFSVFELRALDTLLTDVDPRGAKLPDGTPALALVEKIWRAMLEAEEGGHAHDDQDHHGQPDADHGAPLHQPGYGA